MQLNSDIIEKEGYVPVLGHRLYYQSFLPQNPKGTVLCLHGGPGVPHEYILSMADLAHSGYRVVFYDQLGVGKSELPKNRRLFIVERYVEELESFREALGLGKIHLWGSSWGGFLGIAYALKYQEHLKSLISAGGVSSTPLTYEGMLRLRSELPADIQAILKRYEDAGDYENPEYLKAMDVLYRRHVCRLPQWPPEVNYAFENVSKPVYHTMWGPNEFTLIGNLMYWDVTRELGRIKVPTLITCGRYDEVVPQVGEVLRDGIQDSKMIVFEKSSHLTFWEEREEYIRAMREFLDQNGKV
jgi:proline iminopeptidase